MTRIVYKCVLSVGIFIGAIFIGADATGGWTEGAVTLSIKDTTVTQVNSQKHNLTEAISRFTNKYCQSQPELCHTGDKLIRPTDVSILSSTSTGDDVKVTLRIRDQEDPNTTALTSAQLGNVTKKYADAISSIIQKQVSLTQVPTERSITVTEATPTGGMEAWRIGVIVGATSLAVVILLIIIIVRCRHSKRVRERAKEVERQQRLQKYNSASADPEIADKLQRYESVKYEPQPSPVLTSESSATYAITPLVEDNRTSTPVANGAANGIAGKPYDSVTKRVKNGLQRSPSKRLSDLSSVNVEIENVLSKTCTQSVLQRSVMSRQPIASTISEEADIFLVDTAGTPVTQNGVATNGGPHVTVITNGGANPVENSITSNGHLNVSKEDVATPM